MKPHSQSLNTQPFQESYSYPGGTLHLVPWADLFAGLTLIWLIYFVGGPSILRTKHGLFFLCFGLIWILSGFYWEWTERNLPGCIILNDVGLTCTLPWGRQRHFRWDEIWEVRCIARRFHRDISFWEIRGTNPHDKVVISWELKGYKNLLRTIQLHATHLQRFDATPEDLSPAPSAIG